MDILDFVCQEESHMFFDVFKYISEFMRMFVKYIIHYINMNQGFECSTIITKFKYDRVLIEIEYV